MYIYSVKQAKDTIKEGIKVYLAKKNNRYIMKEVNRLPFYLVGAPGIGKTELVAQVADELGIGFTSCSITHHSRNTVLGLPVITNLEGEERTIKYTEYTMSEIIGKVYEQVEQGHKEGILLIDEFSCMADSLVAPMLAFLQTKNIGSHVLPEGWVLILSSNPPEYNKNARIFDVAIMDRVRYINVGFDAHEFINYAELKKMNKSVIEFLKEKKEYVHHVTVGGKEREKEIVTCRSWENLSYCLDGLEQNGVAINPELVYQFIKCKKIAEEFCKYYNLSTIMNSKEYNDIIEGKNLDKIAGKYKNLSYNSKLKVIKYLYGRLDMACEKYDEIMNHYDYMQKIYLELVDQFVEYRDGSFTGFRNPFGCSSQENVEEVLKNRLNGNTCNMYGISVWNGKKANATEKESIESILLLYRKRLAFGEKESNKLALESYNSWLHNYITNMKKEQMEENNIITNCFTFMEMMDDDLLTENFFNMINTNVAILGVIGRCRNEKYIEYGKKIKELCSIK